MAIGDERQKNLHSATAAGVAGSVSANYLRGIREYLIQRRLDVDAFLADFGLNADVIESASNRIPLTVYEDMLTRAAELADDVDVGLHVGECIKPAQYGALGYSIMSCKTAAEVFERHMRYERLVSDRAVSTYHLEDDQIRLSWDTGELHGGRHTAEENVASWVNIFGWITGQKLDIAEVRFVHPEPPDLSEFQRIFACPVKFEQPMVELIFSADYRHLPIVQHDPVMREMMDAYAEKLLGELSQSDEFLDRVRSLIVESMGAGNVSLDAIAEQLAITPRTLQRRLKEQDESFKTILDEVRKGLALTYIAQPFIDLAELAYLLGFSDQTAFQRAFKKWTGTSPGKYKKQLAE